MKVQATVRFKKISIEAYLDVETMSLVKNIKWQRGKQKRLSKRLDLTFKAYDEYIACWDKRFEKIIFIKLLR